jgi:hypothetical protein
VTELVHRTDYGDVDENCVRIAVKFGDPRLHPDDSHTIVDAPRFLRNGPRPKSKCGRWGEPDVLAEGRRVDCGQCQAGLSSNGQMSGSGSG